MKEKICQFTQVRVRIPKKYIIRLFYSHKILTPKENLKIGQKLSEIDNALSMLEHIKSIVEKIQNKQV